MKNTYKVGNWVYCFRNGGNDSSHKRYLKAYTVKGIHKIIDFDIDSSNNYKVAICENGVVLRIEGYHSIFRHATNKEILQAGGEISKYYEVYI